MAKTNTRATTLPCSLSSLDSVLSGTPSPLQLIRLSSTTETADARNLVALIYPPNQTPDRACIALQQGLLDGIRNAGKYLVTVPGELLQSNAHPIFQQLVNQGVCAMATLSHAGQIFDDWRQHCPSPDVEQIPRVSLLTPQSDSSVILADEVTTAAQMMSHLLSLGHRYFLQFTFPRQCERDIRQPASRIARYEQVLAAHGLNPVHHLSLMEVHARWMQEFAWSGDPCPPDLADPLMAGLAHHLVSYLHDYPQITAVLAANDAIAVRVWYALQSAGIRVPEDISLVGFNGTGYIPGERGENRLTTVAVPLYAIGQRAAQCLLRKLDDHGSTDEVQILPTEFIVRSTINYAAR